MGLFKALEKEVEDRPFYIPPSKRAKPSAKELIRSAQGFRELDLAGKA